MERTFKSNNYASHVERQLAMLKIISRLLAHEVSTQSGPRLTLSREEVAEIQTSIDLFIESILRHGSSAPVTSIETPPTVTRVN